MAAKKSKKTPVPQNKEHQYCRSCAKCYDFHSPAIDGHMILGRCPHKEFSVFLDHDTCNEYRIRM